MGFSLILRIGRVRLTQLENHFSDLEDAWKATPAELTRSGLDSGSIRTITSWRPKISLETEMEKLDRYVVTVLTCHDPDYPARLKEIYDYPPLLYIKGSLLPDDEWCLAVVAQQVEMKELVPPSDTEALPLSQLGAEPTHIDGVCRSSGLSISTISSTLAMMEFKGLVKQVGTMNYTLARKPERNTG